MFENKPIIVNDEITTPGIETPELTPLEFLAMGVPALYGGNNLEFGGPSHGSVAGGRPDAPTRGKSREIIRVVVSDDDSLSVLSVKHGLPIIDLSSMEQDPVTREALPEAKIRQLKVFPLCYENNKLVVVISDPTNIDIQNQIRFALGSDNFVLYLARQESIDAAIADTYNNDMAAEARRAEDAFVEAREPVSKARAETEARDNRVIEFVDWVLVSAVKGRASDIHFEPFRDRFRIRFRVDGKLYVLPFKGKLPPELHRMIISRIKILSELDIATRDRAQDGRLRRKIDGRDVEFRVSITPSQFGEKAVLRKSSSIGEDKLSIDDLGFNDGDKDKFLSAIHRSQGLVLITGPTGSGKTTTLAAALTELNDESVNIMTAEDPIEITIEGITQQAMNEAKQVTFAAALRSFLRQDPDIIMVGEIRDFETAEVAVRAALTGHMVLSTLHTNSTVQTVGRVLDLGVERFNFLPALTMICAQRLVRRVCPECEKKSVAYTNVQLMSIGFTEAEAMRCLPVEPTGRDKSGRTCRHCDGTGYRGRVAIYEILVMTPELRAAFINGSTVDEVLPMAIRQGMTTLRRAGITKVLERVTTISEVLRVTPED